jgi:hypothetical protein
MNPFRWASHSLLGHVVLFEVFFSIPMFIIGFDPGKDGPTLSWVLFSVALCVAGGLVAAILLWYTFSRPLIERQKQKQHRRG